MLSSLVDKWEPKYSIYFEKLNQSQKETLALSLDNQYRYLLNLREVDYKGEKNPENFMFTWCRQYEELIKEFPNVKALFKVKDEVPFGDKSILVESGPMLIKGGYVAVCKKRFEELKEFHPEITKENFYIFIFVPIAIAQSPSIEEPVGYFNGMYLEDPNGKQSTKNKV